jgi:hypothetical protein
MKVIMSEIAKWDSFYVIVGSAAGALIGLQFVVLTLIAERPPVGGAEAGAAFGSPTIVHFGATLFVSALLHVPWQTIISAATLWGLLGFSGVAYTVIVTRRMRKQAAYKPVFEGLAVSWGAAFVRVRNTRAIVIRGALVHARGIVWRGRRDAVVALHRHPQLLGQRRLPCLRRKGEYEQ